MASPAIRIRLIRSPERQRLVTRAQAAREEVRRSVEGPIKNRAIEMANEIVSNWDNKPKFNASIYVTSDKIQLFVEPIGPNAKYWDWTSRGTKPHLIVAGTVAKSGGASSKLLFKTNYQPKTRPGPTWGGPGKATGPLVAARVVHHPGTKPRKFEEYIGKQIKADFKREVENAFRRGVRMGG